MKVMPPERFEQLVLALVKRELPEARRLQHPDGGADILCPATDDTKAKVWQAKRYGDDINWHECENSLSTAIERWNPSEVTFVFARDLSQQLERSFEERLVRHEKATAAWVEVRLWNQSEVVRRLDENPDLKRRFFGEEQESRVVALDRVIKTGGQLQSGADLVERARTLSEYAEQRDIDFTYSIVASAEAPAPQWLEAPYLTVQMAGPSGRVEVATWPRQGADVQLPSFGFTDDSAGQRAREEAVRAWAHGEAAVIREGARVQLHAPEVIRELMPELSTAGGSVQIPAAEPFDAELEIVTATETLTYPLQVRPIPPRPGAVGALVGRIGEATLIEVGFALLDEEHARATFSVRASLGLNARASMEASRLMHAWCRHERMTFRSEKLYPEGIGGRCEVPGPDVCEEMGWRVRLYSDLVFVEEQLGIDVPLPEHMTFDEMNAISTAAEVLRTGEGTATFNQAEGFIENPAGIPQLAEDFRKRAHRQMVSYPIFGREVELGEADYELPPLKVVEIVPYGQTANAPARVVLAAEGDGQMRFRLLRGSRA